MDEPLLRMERIDKSFFGVHALRNVDFELEHGEVHGLIGENGAGKSTLMKILGGVYHADSGTVYMDGREVSIKTPNEAAENGISFIHQELSLFPDLDIATNVFIQHLPNKGNVLKKRELNKNTEAILREVNLGYCKPTQRLGSLQIGERQLVEIARCLAMDTKLLVLDEPTSSLTNNEVEILFKLIRKMKQQGVSIIFISHRLDELFDICDRITVMRDGEKVGTKSTGEVTSTELIRMMIGRELTEMFEGEPRVPGCELLRIESLTHKNRFRDVSLKVNAGEIVGLYGLLGSGRSEIARTIFGLDLPKAGKIYIEGQERKIRSPKEAIRYGIGFVSEDRRLEGLIMEHSIQKNLSVVVLDRLKKLLNYLDVRKESRMCRQNVEDLKIATDRLGKAVKYLSGGNQQKVVIAKWLNIAPKLLILDEPTRGVDVGAKKEIYSILSDLTKQGIGVLVISSELNEVMGLCDRVVVLRKGSVVCELDAQDLTKEKLLSSSMGGSEHGK